MTNQVTLARISKNNQDFKVIYIKNRSFMAKHFPSLVEAIEYAQNSLKASREEIVLSISL